MAFKLYSASEIGDRSNNEDRVWSLIHDQNFLAVVADGLGGHVGGELASELIVSRFHNTFSDGKINDELLFKTVDRINTDIIQLQRDNAVRCMSTIATVWGCAETNEAIAIHVGDTRVYQIRNHSIVYQSKDHSVAQMAVVAGQIPPDAIRMYPERNRLIRALGAEKSVKMECTYLDLNKGDVIIICSDGFWEHIDEKKCSNI